MSAMTRTEKPANSARMEAIQVRHRQLEDQLDDEARRPQPDMAVLQVLKREKLKLKDEMAFREGLLRTLSRGQSAA